MTEKNLIKLVDNMPNIAQEELAKGRWVTYRSDKYQDKIVREFPNGRLEFVTFDNKTEEVVVLEVLKEADEKKI